MFAARNVNLRVDSKEKPVKLLVTFAVLDATSASLFTVSLLRAIGKFVRVIRMLTVLSCSKHASYPCLFFCFLLILNSFFPLFALKGIYGRLFIEDT